MSVELWTEKYRSKTLDDYVIRDDNMRQKIEQWVKEKATPNLIMAGKSGTGKAQPLDSDILTPNGWEKMGNLKVGSEIITPNGKISKVIGVFPQGEKEVWKVIFKDGRTVECCAEHLWEVRHADWNNKTKIIPTDAIFEKLKRLSQTKSNNHIKIKCIENVNYNSNEKLPISPYALGCLLGDGTLYKNGSIRYTTNDKEIIENLSKELGSEYMLTHVDRYDYRIVCSKLEKQTNEKGVFRNPLKIALDNLGLLGLKSPDKFIPTIYKNANTQTRIELLQGLLDTDGTISKPNAIGGGGTINFYSSSIQLIKDVQYIVWSLGGIAQINQKQTHYTHLGEKREGLPSYSLTIKYKYPRQLFKLKRKLDRCAKEKYYFHNSLANEIERVEKTDIMKEMQCIMIDDPDHLYITNDFIPTHNTTLALLLMRLLGIPDCDILFIPASRQRKVEEIQIKIQNFIGTWAMNDTGIKYIILDEFDAISPMAQKSLRTDVETYSDTTRFICTCNYLNKIIDPLLEGRFHVMHFQELAMEEFIGRVIHILEEEKVEWTEDQLDTYIKASYPNLRKCISLIQHKTINGKLTAPEKDDVSTGDYIATVIDLFKKGKLLEGRKFLVSQSQAEDYPDIYRFLYQNLELFGNTQDQQDDALIVIREGLVNHSLVFDPEINLSATLCKLCRVKENKNA